MGKKLSTPPGRLIALWRLEYLAKPIAMEYVLQRLLRATKVRHLDEQEVSFQIKSHPSYPSMHAITGVLDHYHIPNLALDVPTSVETLTQLPEYFLAQIATPSGLEFQLARNKETKVITESESGKRQRFSKESFVQRFTGIMVAIEPDQTTAINSGERVKKLMTTLGVLSVISLGVLLYFQLRLDHFIYTLASAVGLMTSYHIIRKELGMRTSLGDALCAASIQKQDCDRVLESEGATLFGFIKLSDAALVYFLTVLMVSVATRSFQTTLCSLSILVLPISLYSIYYQLFRAKSWCPLCLVLVGTLWLQAGIGFWNWNALMTEPQGLGWIALTAFFGVIASVWYLAVPWIRSYPELMDAKVNHIKFKKNFTIFKALLDATPAYDVQISNGSEIFFGTRQAPLQLTIVTNPACRYCKEVHELMVELLENPALDVGITIRFNLGTLDQNAEMVQVCCRLLELYVQQNQQSCLHAMDDIYLHMEPEAWFAKWGHCLSLDAQLDSMERQLTWCQDRKLYFTPLLLVNGRTYPESYEK